jgi:hypothetical protein
MPAIESTAAGSDDEKSESRIDGCDGSRRPRRRGGRLAAAATAAYAKEKDKAPHPRKS